MPDNNQKSHVLIDLCKRTEKNYTTTPFSEAADADPVCIFGTLKTKPGRCAVYTFDTNRKETFIVETEFREHCAIACLNGKS